MPKEKIETLEDLPEKYRKVFESYFTFNSVQTQALSCIFELNSSLVIVAPTGSGKTAILELAIVKLLMDLEKTKYQGHFKVVYICPVKALCCERYHDWCPRFESLGVSCIEVTGDSGDYFDLQGHNLVITTPEKWDSLTRKWRDNASLVQLVKLFLIDEVHLVSDNQRGPVLEAIVCRMKTISKTLKIDCMRFVAISATVYNVEDLAAWLGTEEVPAAYYKFGNEVRPVHLEKIVKGYAQPPGQSAFLFDIQLSYKLKNLILEYAKGKPTMVFCSTRKSVLQTAKILSEQLTFHFTNTQFANLQEGSCSLGDNKLKDLVLAGIGYHHAGMSVGDRHIVQNLFVSGSLPILVATSALAMGVNLPVHLVIIKSTQQFKAGQVEEYPESSVLQMIGRAGRPQFDTTAVAIIMTRNEMVKKYERLLDSKEIIESSLHLHLPEHLNSEIVLYTITDLSVAMEWIRCTFLYVRAIKNPKHYGFDPQANQSKIEKCLETICLREINGLKKAELIEVSDNGMDISPTSNGRLMSHFYLSFQTFKIFLDIKGTETVPEILKALTEAHEFSEIQLRVNERRTLNELNRNKIKDHIRFPLPGKIKSRAMKINCLVQSCLGCLPILDPALYQESIRVVKIAERLAKCLVEFLSKKPHFQSLLSAVTLAKCLHARLWDNSPFLSRQLDRIGPTFGSLLASHGKTTFAAIEKSNPRDLERILNRAPPLGNHLQDSVQHLPKYKLAVLTTQTSSLCFHTKVTVSLLNADCISEKNTAGDHHWVALIVGDTDNKLLSYNRFTDRILLKKDVQVSVSFKFPHLPHKVIANVISEQWIGIDVGLDVVICEISENISSPKISAISSVKKRKIDTGTKSILTRELEYLKEYQNKTGGKAGAQKHLVQHPLRNSKNNLGQKIIIKMPDANQESSVLNPTSQGYISELNMDVQQQCSECPGEYQLEASNLSFINERQLQMQRQRIRKPGNYDDLKIQNYKELFDEPKYYKELTIQPEVQQFSSHRAKNLNSETVTNVVNQTLMKETKTSNAVGPAPLSDFVACFDVDIEIIEKNDLIHEKSEMVVDSEPKSSYFLAKDEGYNQNDPRTSFTSLENFYAKLTKKKVKN